MAGPAEAALPEPEGGALPSVLAHGARFLRSFHGCGPLLLAVSGGSDSTALLHVFHTLSRSPEFSGLALVAATVDHGLRPGSRAEAEAVARLCAALSIPHRILSWQGEKPLTALQASARAARYGLLVKEALQVGAAAILLGHTAGDQRETIAMRAARGEGPGLAGMAPAVLLQERIWAMRPFLELEREDLRAALRQGGHGWFDDPSNANRRFERVRLREEGKLGPVPANAGEIRRAEAEREADWLLCHATVLGGAVGRVHAAALADIEGPGAGAIFRLSAALGGRIHSSGRSERARMLDFIRSGLPGRHTLGGTVFDRRREALYLYRENRGLRAERLPAGAVYDGRYRLDGPDGASAEVQPVAGFEAAAAGLEASGVPAALARRAAPALVEVAAPQAGFGLARIIAGQADFVPSFDLPVADALRQIFCLSPLPLLPVRQ